MDPGLRDNFDSHHFLHDAFLPLMSMSGDSTGLPSGPSTTVRGLKRRRGFFPVCATSSPSIGILAGRLVNCPSGIFRYAKVCNLAPYHHWFSGIARRADNAFLD